MNDMSHLRRRTAVALFLTAFCLLGAPAPWACRIIIPPPWPGPWPPPQPVPMPLAMEVRSHQASIEIDGHRARVTVEALFHNPNPVRVEGTYLFPVAPLAAVSSFAMTVDGKTVEAELLDADKARKIYEDIVRRQRDPALLEYLDQGLLRARVFPIEPGKDVKVTLAYEQVVRQEGTRTRLVYPLVSVRPEGGNKVEKLRIDVKIRADAPVKGLFCPGFDAAVKKLDANSATVSFEATNYLPDKDFEVIFSQDKRKVGVDFLATRRGDDGYFLMLVAPNSELQAAEIAAKDIVFVLDTSGSMQGDKLNQAKQALLFCVNNLNATDSFNLITFANDVDPLSPQPVPATEANRAKARTFIADIKALGGTAIDDVLAAVVAMPPRPGHVPLAVLLTDGLPTVGEIEPAKILNRVDKHGDRRFFTFGVGYDVNTRLLDGIAAGAGGTSSYVRPGENLELALSSFYEKVAFPVLTDLQLDTGTAKLMDMNPRRLPDLFKGGQALITGRFTGTGKLSMKLSGVIGGVRETFPFDADLTGETRNAFIPRLWAVSRVGFLQEQIRLNGQNAELVDEIKRLGKQYGILTPYTSFLIVEEAVRPEQLARARDRFSTLESDARADSGGAAVESARAAQSMKGTGFGGWPAGMAAAPATMRNAARESGLSDADVDRLVVAAGDKTFFRRQTDGFWYDSEIPAGETPKADIDVKAWSPEFFKLLAQYPALRQYALAGPYLVVKLDGKIIRITGDALRTP